MTLASLTLIATSAPTPALLIDEGDLSAQAGQVATIDVSLNEDAVSDTTGLSIDVDVEPVSGADPVTVTIERSDGKAVDTLAIDSGVRFGSIDDCPEDGDCKQSFRVVVSPDVAYELHVTATASNEESGCPISNPDYGDDATLTVTVK